MQMQLIKVSDGLKSVHFCVDVDFYKVCVKGHVSHVLPL